MNRCYRVRVINFTELLDILLPDVNVHGYWIGNSYIVPISIYGDFQVLTWFLLNMNRLCGNYTYTCIPMIDHFRIKTTQLTTESYTSGFPQGLEKRKVIEFGQGKVRKFISLRT